MSFLLTAGGALLVLFVISYLRAGRFGATILAFGVGYLLAAMWTDTIVAFKSVPVPGVPWRDVVYALLIVTPGILALLFSPKQKSLLPRIVQAFLIAVFAVALLLPILGLGGGHIGEFYTILEKNRDVVVTLLLLLGLFDMVISRSEHAPKSAKH